MTAPAVMSMTPANQLGKRKRYELLRGQLEDQRASFIPSWRDANDFIRPRKARFFVSDVNKGDRRSQKIIDSTATMAARTLSSGMMAGITSPSRPWYRMTTADPDLAEQGDVKEWLHTVTQRTNSVFLRSNLYNALPVLYEDLGIFGTGAIMEVEDLETTVRFINLPVGSYLIANDERGKVRVFHRTFQMTVRQMIGQFGYDACSLRARNLWTNGNTEVWIDVCQCIVPNDEYNPNLMHSKYKRFASCYYEKGTAAASNATNMDDTMLAEEGYDEFPVFAVRWSVTGEDVYGTDCPGFTALGDIKQLQLGAKRVAQAIDKLVNPPMIAPTSMIRSKASILPGDVSYGDGSKDQSFRPVYEINPRIAEQENLNQQIRLRIQRAMYEDLFLMLAQSDRREITAREIDERHEEKLLAIGPVLEQLNQDLLDPLHDRTFAIMLRAGLIPEPPESLSGASLKVEYISVMAQAQKLVGISSLDRFASFAFQAAALDETVLDKIDRDQLIQEYAEATGIPPKIVLSDDQVAQIRQARAQAQQQQAQQAQIASMTQSAKNLSQADTSGRNALTDLIGSTMPQAA